MSQNLKVVLLGNSGVGKTSVAFRWTTSSWQKEINPTVGANHQRKTVKLHNKDTDVYVWDTAGQEQFQALTPLYVRSSCCAIIMASLDDENSFQSLSTWTELVQSACEKVPPYILAVNKIDLEDSIDPGQMDGQNADEPKSIMKKEDIESRFSKEFSSIMYVSAKTGEGVDELFILAADMGLKFLTQSSEAEKQPKLTINNEKKGCC